MNKTYLELSQLKTFEERFKYLQLNGAVGQDTFGFNRYLNQALYGSKEWRKVRNEVIIRDNGCDLGVYGYDICDRILIHHLNPITVDDVLNRNPEVFDLNNLICVSHRTHNAIHYGDESLLVTNVNERSKNDTCLWKH